MATTGQQTRPKTSWELRAEAAEAQRDDLRAALREVVTNGERRGAEWCISFDVYGMVEDAIAKATGGGNHAERHAKAEGQ